VLLFGVILTDMRAYLRPLVLLRSRSIPVTGVPGSPSRPGSMATTSMPQPRRKSDMAGTSTPCDVARAVHDQVRAVPE
jgi:hypothetical protein